MKKIMESNILSRNNNNNFLNILFTYKTWKRRFLSDMKNFSVAPLLPLGPAGVLTPAHGIGAGAPHLRLEWGEDRPRTILMIKKHRSKETTDFLGQMARLGSSTHLVVMAN